jgi:hypothetical protein
MESWLVGEAEEQARRREINRLAYSGQAEPGDLCAYRCECGDASCTETIRLTGVEYTFGRAGSTRFMVARDHENPEVERLVSENAYWAVIETLPGEPSRVARATYYPELG